MTIKKLSEIKPDKNQPRKTFEEEPLKNLAESILGNGLLKPIEVDENGIIIDGERRYRACKLAKLKEVEVRIVKIKGDEAKRLRHQLVVDIQDEDIPTGERYEALVRLWKMSAANNQNDFCKDLGLGRGVLQSAFDYCEFAEEEPELAKQVSARVIADTKSLPKEERKELIEAFKNVPKEEKKAEFMRHLVKEKKQQLQERKQLEELRKKVEESKEAKKWEIKVTTTKEVLENIRDEIFRTNDQLNKMIFNIKRVRKTKFYLYKARDKEVFFKVLDGAIMRVDKWGRELQDFKEAFELEIVKE